jgi:uncharacterized glyoxalase superfamily protein PhnB
MASHRPNLSSGISYRDPRAAIVWLEKALGFETVMLLEGADGSIVHSELHLGDGAVMVGGEWDAAHRSPASLEGINTQSIHIHVDTDIDAHCARAKAAGADVFADPETQFYGDRIYRCRDPEGHVWTVGQTVKVVTREEAQAATGLKITGWS